MEDGGTAPGICESEGVRALLGDGPHLLARLQGLVGMTEQPQDQGRVEPASHTGVLHDRQRRAWALLTVMEGDRPRQVRLRSVQLS